MRSPNTIRLRSLRMSLMLAAVLSLPASTTALSIAASDMELDPAPRPADAPATPSIWDTPAPIQVRPVLPKPAAPPRPLGANPLWAIPLASLSNTRERPIFSPSRRPPPAQTPLAVAVPPAPPPPPPPRVERPPLTLVGTVAGESESFGIFVDNASSTALRLKVGEDYQGWRLRVVQGRDVSLERDQQTVVLSLPEPGVEAGSASSAGRVPMPVMPANTSLMPATAEDEQAPPPPRRRR